MQLLDGFVASAFVEYAGQVAPRKDRHTPPPGLAFGEPDDRLQRSIQYAATLRFIIGALEYRVARSSRAMTAWGMWCMRAR